MYYTVIIMNAPEGPTLSYDLVFHPNPIWFQGHIKIGIPPDNIKMENKCFSYLLTQIDKSHVQKDILGQDIHSTFTPQKIIKIVCHDGGHGSNLELQNLINNIEEEGYKAIVMT
jgi:hypothetical protein